MADITHGTWIKDGKAVDTVYQSGVKVYGRNLLINTTGNMIPTMATTPNYATAGRASQSTDGVTTITQAGDISGEFYYRPMNPDATNLYGLVPGETYTFSGQILSSNNSATIDMRSQNSTDGNWTGDMPLVILPVNTSFQPFSVKFTVPPKSIGFYFSIQEYNFSAGDSFSFKQLKLEVGDQTAFSIAPEDILNRG